MTHRGMEIDYWANHYADIKAKGGNVVEDEDEDFNMEDILAQIDAEAEAEEAEEQDAQAEIARVDDWEEEP